MKICPHLIGILLNYLYNHFMETDLSAETKWSIIKPLHKKGDKLHITNYRPLYLLLIFPKIYEKTVYK